MSVSCLFEPEVQALIQDFDLVPLSSFEAQDSIRAFFLKLPVGDPFFEDRLSYSRSCYSNLLEMYYKYNSKGKNRSFGVSLNPQLELF